VVDPRAPLDRARRVLLGTLSNSAGTPPWVNPGRKYYSRDHSPTRRSQCWSDFARRVATRGDLLIPFDRARRDLLGTPPNIAGTPPWANLGRNYFGESEVSRIFWQRVKKVGQTRVPLDRARRVALGTPPGRVGTPSWANPGRKYCWFE
jgi:hypothetical protein